MDWKFLLLTLMEFSFLHEIVTLIMNFTTSTSFSLKWNGEKLEVLLQIRVCVKVILCSFVILFLCMEKLSLLTQ